MVHQFDLHLHQHQGLIKQGEGEILQFCKAEIFQLLPKGKTFSQKIFFQFRKGRNILIRLRVRLNFQPHRPAKIHIYSFSTKSLLFLPFLSNMMNSRDCRHISIRQHSTFLRRINRLTLKTHRRRLGKSKSQERLQRQFSSGLDLLYRREASHVNQFKEPRVRSQKLLNNMVQKNVRTPRTWRTILFNSFSIIAQAPFLMQNCVEM